ncbi:glutathione S-transferase [Folsomia candida]|uniref:glutathione transferase n=1 Tax=Folsomia candida TaxID=158441 RepID=A0A226D601_FOLCA|nr:glutathione S-transferase [Folsomia candida]OXA40520.1 Glutathione S-transferase [Folsomia candida]
MSYKLTYFDFKGRGEAIRLLLATAGVKFADDRVKLENWPSIKPHTPWEMVPVLHVGDRSLSQSLTICRYIARKFKLMGANEWEASKCDEYAETINDLYLEWIKFNFEADPDKKAELKNAFLTTLVPKYLIKLNTLQSNNGGNFLVGNTLTWADIFVADKLQTFEDTVDQGVLNEYPHLRKMKDAVFAEPRIKAYIEGR